MKLDKPKLVIRVPVSKVGVIKHKPKKGKGSYDRNESSRVIQEVNKKYSKAMKNLANKK